MGLTNGLTVGVTDGLIVALGTGEIDGPGIGTNGAGDLIGVGETPGLLFRIGWSVGSGLALGAICPPGLMPGCAPPGLVAGAVGLLG